MPVGGPEALVGLVLVAVFLPLVAAVRDWRRWPLRAWREAGRSRWSWLAVVLLPLVGPVLYARRARPPLRRAARDVSAPC